jgi:DNA repair exonuclease SbcCD ATPase subunit
MSEEGQAAASGELVAKLRGRAKQDAIRFGSYGFYTPADVLLDNEAADTIDALERRVREAEEKLDDYKTNVIEDMRLDRDTAEAALESHIIGWNEAIARAEAVEAALAAWKERAEAAEGDYETAQRQLREMGEALKAARDTLGRGQPDRNPERKEAHRILCAALASQPSKPDWDF